jgi:hypothetical protein
VHNVPSVSKVGGASAEANLGGVPKARSQIRSVIRTLRRGTRSEADGVSRAEALIHVIITLNVPTFLFR